MSNNRQSISEFRFTGWHMLAIMSLFFGTIVAVNLYMAVVASGTWTGLVVKNSYVASQGFNDQLTVAKAQERSGVYSNFHFDDNKLLFQIFDHSGLIQTVERAQLWVGRPTFEQQDHSLTPHCSKESTCEVAMRLSPGDWSIVLTAEISGSHYRRDVRINVSEAGKVTME